MLNLRSANETVKFIRMLPEDISACCSAAQSHDRANICWKKDSVARDTGEKERGGEKRGRANGKRERNVQFTAVQMQTAN